MKNIIVLFIFIILIIFINDIQAQWQPANGVGGSVTCFASCPNGSGGTNIFAGTTDGVILSTDNGLTWTSVSNGLTCMSVHALAVSKNETGGYNIFAGTGVTSSSGLLPHAEKGGVFLSTNQGANWSYAGLDSINVISLAAYPNGTGDCNLFAGGSWGSNYHLFSSTNSGITWSPESWDSVLVNSLSSYPSGGGGYSIYAGLGNIFLTGRTTSYLGGAYRSTDNGATWSCLLTGYTNSIAVKDSDIYAGTYFGLYHSSNDGKSWTADTITLNGYALPNQSNSGSTSITSITAIPDGRGGTILFAGIYSSYGSVSINALVRSTDSGKNWSWPIIWPASVSAIPNGTGGFNLFVSGQKLLRSTDEGITWVTSNIGMSNANISLLTTAPNSTGGSDLITSYYPNFLLHSTNDGATWMDVDTTGMESGLLNTSATSFSTIKNDSGGTNFYTACYGTRKPLGFSIASTTDYVSFNESTNNGTSWNNLISNNTNPFLYNDGICMAAVQNKTSGYNLLESGVLASNSIHFSTDNGSTWQNEGSNASSFVVNDSIVYAVGSTLSFSTDGGISWTSVNNPGSMVSSFAAKDGYLLEGTVSSGIFLSTDNGTTWDAINNGAIDSVVKNSEISSVAIVQDGSGGYKFFAGTCASPQSFGTSGINSHLFLSSDLGATWNEVSDGLPQDGAVTNLVVKTDRSGISYLYAGFSQPQNASFTFPCYGIWKRSLSELVDEVKEPSNQSPIRFSLEQNYPNPFNPSTTIQYEIPQSGLITIKVYDVLAREVITLVNQYQNSGKHEINFNAANFSSGVYFYQLRAGNFISTKKMILLR